jgi:putative addiction module killer protein
LADKRISLVCQIWHTKGEVSLSKPRVHRSKKYKDWYRSLSEKDQGIVDTRVDTYVEHGELLKSKSLDPKFGLYEFKWDSGLRVYYAFFEDNEGRLMLLLLGGNKNSQASDITEAKNIVLKAVTKIVEKKKKGTKKSVVKKKRGENE